MGYGISIEDREQRIENREEKGEGTVDQGMQYRGKRDEEKSEDEAQQSKQGT